MRTNARARHHRAAACSLALATLLTAGLAACGKSEENPGIASAGGKPTGLSTSTTAGPQDFKAQALAFSKCMRENGIPDYPDPTFDGNRMDMRMPQGVTPGKVEDTQKKCQQFMPGSGGPGGGTPDAAMLVQMRTFSKCMRENGLPDFPDPDPSGKMVINGRDGGVMSPDSPQFKKAEEACRSNLPGPAGGQPSGTRTSS